jgi:hypothetical protein
MALVVVFVGQPADPLDLQIAHEEEFDGTAQIVEEGAAGGLGWW